MFAEKIQKVAQPQVMMKRNSLLMVVLVVLALVLAFVDAQIPSGATIWILYIVLIVFSLGSGKMRFPLVMAALCSVLLVAGYFVKTPPHDQQWISWLSRFSGLVAIWAVAYIVDRFFGWGKILADNEEAAEALREKLAAEAWLRKGLMAINEAMRGVQSSEGLCRNLLAQMAQHVGANVGSFYLADETSTLRRTAIYAYADSGDVADTIAPNEGLLGQAAAELKVIELNDVPSDYYLKIKSSLGELTPRHLVAIPVFFDGRLNGVMELGSLQPFSAAARLLFGIIPENIGIAVDLATSRRRLQEILVQSQKLNQSLQSQQEYARSLLEASLDPLVTISAEGKITDVNEGSVKVTGVPRENLIGTDFSDYFTEPKHARAGYKQAFEIGSVTDYPLTVHHKDGRLTDVLYNASVYRNAQGDVLGVFAAARDVTIQKQSNFELERKQLLLEKQKEALEEANALLHSSRLEIETASRYKSEFLSNMSHELRTPLNSILVLAQILSHNKSKRFAPDDVDAMLTIISAGSDLLNLINDILDLSKIESGKLELESEEVSLVDLAANLERTFRPMAEQKNLALEFVFETSALVSVFTDRQRLEQILKNLLSNAIKFTEHGTVTVRIWHAEDTDRPIGISVSDTGIGIADDKQEVIFEAFKQADGTTARRFGGTGLGLSISRELTVLLQGEIDLESRVGMGSTFSVFLPQQLTMRSHVRKIPAPGVGHERSTRPTESISAHLKTRSGTFTDDRAILKKGDRCLLTIEDNHSFSKTLSKQFQELGYKSLRSEDGESGLADAREFLPDGILLDMKLPGISGIEVLEQLKKDPKTSHIPVQVVSGYDNRKNAMHLGAIGYLMKPVSATDLGAAVAGLENKASDRIKRVLLVDANPEKLRMTAGLIGEFERIETIEVPSMKATLAELGTADFDCIVLDVRLPDKSGIQLLAALAEDKSRACPPVIIYTDTALTNEESTVIQTYSESLVIKCVHAPVRFLEEAALILHRSESSLPADKRKMLEEYRESYGPLVGANILLVDDDMRNIFALCKFLEGNGAAVTVARNGQEALDRLERAPDLHLVLMDIMMPVMDGIEAMRKIRSQRRFQKLPIIALTAKAMKGDREQCIEAGANDYLAKPIDVGRLLSLSRVWLSSQGI